MPGLGPREFECTLCQQSFTMPSGDLIVPQPRICDDCLSQVWEMEDQALTEHVIRCLPDAESAMVDKVVQHIKGYKGYEGGLEGILQWRKMFG